MRALGFVKVGKNRFVCSIVGEITLFRTTVQTEQHRSERMSGVEVLRCILYVDDTVWNTELAYYRRKLERTRNYFS